MGMLVAVAAVVFLLEVVWKVFRQRDVEFVALPPAADVYAADGVNFSRPRFAADFFRGSFLELGEFAVQLCLRNFPGDAPEYGARIVFHYIAGKNAEGGERAGERGDDHMRNA